LVVQALPRFQLFSDLLGYIAGILDAVIDIIDGKKFGECTGASLDLGSDDEQTCLWMEWSGVRVDSTPLQWILAGVESSTGVHWSPVIGATLAENDDHRSILGPGTWILFALLHVGYAWHVSDQSESLLSRSWRLLESTGGLELSDLQSTPVQ
jgi:hypothetical protein